MESFLKEYNTFKQYADQQNITTSEAETTQLFAIFRKDERTNRIMEMRNGSNKENKTTDNGEQPATEKQKTYVKNIYEQNGISYNEEEMQKLTKNQASEIINSLKGRG